MAVKTWMTAARPKTLMIGLSPLLLVGSLNICQGTFNLPIFVCALIATLSIQVGVNFINDLGDFLKKADTPKRKGPTRVMASGVLPVASMIKGIALTFLVTLLASLYLIVKGGFLLASLTALSILCAFLYTMGPYSLSYLGIADIFAFAFFGPIPVAVVDKLMTGHFSWQALLLGCSPGFFSAAALTVNNVRDREEDKNSCKMSPPVRFGLRFGQRLYLVELILAMLIPIAATLLFPKIWPVALCATYSAFLPKCYRQLCSDADLNELLAQTARLNLFFTLTLSLCLLLSTLIS